MHNGSSFTDNAETEMNEKYPSGEYRNYQPEDYARLNENIKLYKQGNAEAAEYIVASFHGILKKYADFICCRRSEHEGYIKNNSSVSRFVKLFIKSGEYKQSNAVQKITLFSEACKNIQKIFRSFEYMDIYNELVCVLLNMASKYKVLKPGDKYYKENGTFHLYVDRCFHYDVFNSLKKIAGDPLGFIMYTCDEEPDEESNYSYSNGFMISAVNSSVIPIDQDTEKHYEEALHKADRDICIKESHLLTQKEEKPLNPFDDESLNFNWTNGVTCSDEFLALSPYERELLVLSYRDKKKDGEISEMFNCCRATILKHRNKAVNKLRDEINRQQPEQERK